MPGMSNPVPTTFDLIEIREQLSTADWAEKRVYLSPRIPTSEPGMWQRSNVAAWCRPGGPLEAMDDPDVETVTACCAAQAGKTTTSYVWLMKEMATDPSSCLFVMNSTIDAREKSEETWLPLWEDSPKLQEYLPTNRRRQWTKLYQRINGSPAYWIGANSPGRLGAKPIRRLILDERDKYPKQTKRETGAAHLAIQRTKAFRKKQLAKIINMSTPTDEAGIWQDYLLGDQRKLFVTCESCGYEHIMEWSQFKIDMKMAKEKPEKAIEGAHYECPKCGAIWPDEVRYKAIGEGQWKATAVPKDPRCRSYHVPTWTSKFVTHAYLAAQWIKAQDDITALQDFVNGECAEPWREPPKKSIGKKKIAAIKAKWKYDQRTVPTSDDYILLSTIDVQSSHIPFAVWAMDLNNQWLIDHGSLSTWGDIDLLKDMEYHDQDGRAKKIQVALLDTGHDTVNAYWFCLGMRINEYGQERPGPIRTWIVPIKGDTGKQTNMGSEIRTRPIKQFPSGRMFPGGIKLMLRHLHPSAFKDQLAMAIDVTLEDNPEAAAKYPVKIWFHQGIDDNYLDQITAEVLKESKPDKHGNTYTFWEQIRKPNDQFDLAQYAFAARHMLRPHLIKLKRRETDEVDSEIDEVEGEETDKPKEAGNGRRKRKREIRRWID
jgi:phage terminase large subunit GpA-like protein